MATEMNSPSKWLPRVLAEFEALVLAGGEVAGVGLRNRIAEAQSLACHFVENQLVAIAALKNPRASYMTKLRERTGYDLTQERYRYEVGWVYVAPEHRGAKLSRSLMETCLTVAGTAGMFATTRKDNVPMQRTLQRYGFAQVGTSYKSERGDVLLKLFVREGA